MTALPLDPDAVLWSASERDRAGRPLLVLLHGYGSNEADLFDLAPYLPLSPVIASLRAPIPMGPGHAWFELGAQPGVPDPQGVTDAARSVLDWLGALTVQPSSVGLLGFSQGGAMALQLMRLEPARFDYAVVLAGFLAGGSQAGDTELGARKPPVFWGRGTADAVISAVAVDRTQAWLPGHTSLTERIYEGLGHAVSQAELADTVAFLNEQYA
ncbi:alpha/beta hydrolase [Microterricola pindariensis]|uniref:Phospholipase n=1 Tax=Microterricola pindariensis TaxID=478010 RepID=A0ABX5AXQ5_9MICO|nr:dienelactone hydrolase family protein [Microterricola pindariensis]PPL19159.1 phospholipase [Microterricola pindariensis]